MAMRPSGLPTAVLVITATAVRWSGRTDERGVCFAGSEVADDGDVGVGVLLQSEPVAVKDAEL
jgi:hypothetical protein